MTKISVIVVAAVLVLVMSGATSTEMPFAVSIRYAVVEFQRADTPLWFSMSPGARMPMSAGDSMRTDERGRALLSFGASAQALLLPASSVSLTSFAIDADGLALEMQIEGRLIFERLTDGRAFVDFALQAGDVIITQPAEHFAVEARTDGSVYVIVSAGEAEIKVGANDTPVVVSAGMGVRIRSTDISESILLTYPRHFAQLEALLDGCPAVITPSGESVLNVRSGPGGGFARLGTIDRDVETLIVGISENGGRYRIPYFSGFGWVIVDGVTTACTDLPIYPDDTKELFLGAINEGVDEVPLLRPYYGLPDEDPLFYRFR